MDKNEILGPGMIWVRNKQTNKDRIIPETFFKPEFHVKLDPLDPVSLEAIPSELKVEEPPSLVRDDLASLSFKELQTQPEYKALTSKTFRDKEGIIKAILSVREAKKSES